MAVLKLKKANEKTNNVYTSSNKVKRMLENLKPTLINKNNSVISNDNINEFKTFIEEVQETAKSVSSVNDLNIMIKEIDKRKQLFYNNRTNLNGDDVNEKHKERKSNF